eukprot:3466852-Rhodomonas_salina.1
MVLLQCPREHTAPQVSDPSLETREMDWRLPHPHSAHIACFDMALSPRKRSWAQSLSHADVTM